MRFLKIDLTDDQLLKLAKIALAPGGVVGDWGDSLAHTGIDHATATWLGAQGYVEPVTRDAVGGPLPFVAVTAKGRRELMIRFID
jgi:hypothetical protein